MDTPQESDSNIEKPYFLYLKVNGKRLKMGVETGTAVSAISENLHKRTFRKLKLVFTNCVLRTYSQQSLKPKGKISVNMSCKGVNKKLYLLVVECSGPALLGRDWLRVLKLDWSSVKKLKKY